MQTDLGDTLSMAVVPLTLCISLALAFSFVLFFMLERSRKRFSSTEQDSLLPLGEEISRSASTDVVNRATASSSPTSSLHA